MSTVSPVRTAICWATALIRSSDTGSGPVTPATRTRMTLIGSAVQAAAEVPAVLQVPAAPPAS